MAKDDDEDPSPTRKPSSPITNHRNNGRAVGSPRTPGTGIRKTSGGQKNAPRSAPARNRTGALKPRNEPTLLGDFLLGRPSPNRKTQQARRKSLDAVKAEMRVNNISQVQAPGKVQERVKQWQKNNANAGPMEHDKDLEEIVVEYETESEVEVTPMRKSTPNPRPKSRTPDPSRDEDVENTHTGASPRPGRRKDRDESAKGNEPEEKRNRSVAPKKRVISDQHWMKNRRRSPPSKGNTIPKNFLESTAINPPVERKIEDWVKRMAVPEPPEKVETPKRKVRRAESEESEEKPRSRKVSRRSPRVDGIRVRASSRPSSPDDEIRIKPSKDRPRQSRSSASKPSALEDDGIRIKPSPLDDGIRIKPSPVDDGIRVGPSDDTSVVSEIQIKRTRNDGSKRRPKEEEDTPTPSPRKKSEHLGPPTESDSRTRKTSYTTITQDDDATSYMNSSPSKRRNRKSDATDGLDDIPFGNSAFSVLDLPLGAEANTMKRPERPEPKRNNSFAAVPKVLKRVYTEGMKRVHDTEPPRGGPNQPPSIEKWLNGTTDPFTDRPATAEAPLPVPKPSVPRMPSFKEEDRPEHDVTPEREYKQRKVSQKIERETNSPVTPFRRAANRDSLPSMGASPPISPSGLKRTPATRAASSPKTVKKFGLKDAIFDAFKGESAMAKTAIPSPFDFIGLREGDVNPDDAESSVLSDLQDVPRYVSPKTSPKIPARSALENVEHNPRAVPVYFSRPPPVAGGPSLSTIASVTSFSNSSSSSSVTGTGSDLSQTTITQGTVLSGTTGSSLSRGSKKSVTRKESQIGQMNTNLKRTLTNHADLVSMLSLPDTKQPGRAQSIRSTRSLRTKRIRLEDATIEDLLREVSEDEVKYIRELNTLVDGIIPVLLTCVLSKSNAAIAAGLFEPLANPAAAATSFTKPIVDMGVALEKLRSLHKRISLTDPDSFLNWTEQVLTVYEAYLRFWRTGFEDVVVNLAPASRKASSSADQDDSLPVNQNGDMVKDTGEVVDVAHLLKAPMRRLKLLNRIAEGIHMKRPTKKAEEILEAVRKAETLRRERIKEEIARQEDLKANMTDTTRARDPKTLEPVEDVTIDRSRQVSMKDVFQFDLYHSTGQRMECEVELTFRETIRKTTFDKHEPGDVLISQMIDNKSSLLFPPVIDTNISARKGDNENELVVMIRGGDNKKGTGWKEMFVLEAADREMRDDWLDILPATPFPGLVIRKTMSLDPEVSSLISAPGANLRSIAGSLKGKIPNEVPIGERRRRQYEELDQIHEHGEHMNPQPLSPETYPEKSRGPMTTVIDRIGEDAISELSDDHVYDSRDLNDYMTRLGHRKVRPIQPISQVPASIPKDTKWATRCVEQDVYMSPAVVAIEENGAATFDAPQLKGLPKYTPPTENQNAACDSQVIFDSIKLPKLRSPKAEMTTPLKEYMRPDLHSMSKSRPTSSEDDGPPPPPAHTLPVTPPSMKNIPVVDSITPKAKNRRTSSPLKHEYQPSTASADVSSDEFTDSDEYTESCLSEDSLEEVDDFDEDEKDEIEDNLRSLPTQSAIHGRSAEAIAPLHSAPQVPEPSQRLEFSCAVSFWNKDRWDYVHQEFCTVIVGDGWIDTYESNNPYSARDHYDAATSTVSLIAQDEAIKNPLVSQDLTPSVNIRQSNFIDTQIRSPMNYHSRFQKAGYMQYRVQNPNDAAAFYAAIQSARQMNKKYRALSQQRMINGIGNSPAPQPARRSWFTRRKSFRRGNASDADESVPPSAEEPSFSPLQRFRGGRLFNIGRSSVSRVPGTAGSSSSGFSSISPPDTPLGGSQAPGSMQSSGTAVRPLGNRNLPIILHCRVKHSWANHGTAFLTVSEPEPGQLQASYASLYSGPKKHVRVCLGSPDGRAVIDEVLGADSFNRGGNTGIFVEIWRGIVDERGVEGVVPSRGGVGGRTEKWCFQSRRQGDCEWIFTLLKSVVGFEGM